MLIYSDSTGALIADYFTYVFKSVTFNNFNYTTSNIYDDIESGKYDVVIINMYERTIPVNIFGF